MFTLCYYVEAIIVPKFHNKKYTNQIKYTFSI